MIMVDNVSDTIKEEITGIEKLDDTKIFIRTNDKLPDDIATKCYNINCMGYKRWL